VSSTDVVYQSLPITHLATNVNVIPQVPQSPGNFPRRSKPKTYGWNQYLVTSWINLATATMHKKLTGNVPIMESAEKCVWYTK
jgi:hypothetical protein